MRRDHSEALSPDRYNIIRLALITERDLGNTDQALAYSYQLISMAERLYGSKHTTYLTAESALASTLLKSGQIAEARSVFLSAVERANRVVGPDSSLLAALLPTMHVTLPSKSPTTFLKHSQCPNWRLTLPNVHFHRKVAKWVSSGWAGPPHSCSTISTKKPLWRPLWRPTRFSFERPMCLRPSLLRHNFLLRWPRARLGRKEEVERRIAALGADRARVGSQELAQKLANAEPLIGEMK
ncbi:MAG: tetratricopeptide repeat protein [Rhodanobacteraceae bacterium]|nr:tetratricopeptide repeat protein [Rhodanobacteraceae bacterium]